MLPTDKRDRALLMAVLLVATLFGGKVADIARAILEASVGAY